MVQVRDGRGSDEDLCTDQSDEAGHRRHGATGIRHWQRDESAAVGPDEVSEPPGPLALAASLEAARGLVCGAVSSVLRTLDDEPPLLLHFRVPRPWNHGALFRLRPRCWASLELARWLGVHAQAGAASAECAEGEHRIAGRNVAMPLARLMAEFRRRVTALGPERLCDIGHDVAAQARSLARGCVGHAGHWRREP